VLTNLQNILLVDVREPDEVALGSIPSSVCLPLSQLRDALDPNYNAGEFQKVSAATPATPANSAISRAVSSPLHPHSHLFHVPGITPPPWCGVVWALMIELTCSLELRLPQTPPLAEHHLLRLLWQALRHRLRVGGGEGLPQRAQLRGELVGLDEAGEGERVGG
jgi:hypothetical protein